MILTIMGPYAIVETYEETGAGMPWGEANKLRRASEAEATKNLPKVKGVKKLEGKIDGAVKAQDESDGGDSFRKRHRN